MLAIGLLFALRAAAGPAAAPEIPAFSTAPTGTPPAGWKVETLRGRPPTSYRVVEQDARRVLEARADAAASGLSHTLRYDAGQWPRLRWQWRIDAHLPGTDIRQRAGDDFPARVYVSFDYDIGELPLGTRVRLALARLLYGARVPGATLCYVWDPALPAGTIMPGAYTDRVRMLIVRSGSSGLGRWHTETRDVAADYRAAFGEPPPPVTAITLAADTDDTRTTATSYFGDLEVLPAAP